MPRKGDHLKIVSKWLACFILIGFFCLLFFSGAGIAYLGLNDSDTCWLLSMGRWIVQHRTLALVDPFSTGVHDYATIIPGKPLAQYQWLAEVVFYCIYKLGGLIGLQIIVSTIICITYVIVPYLILQKARCSITISLLLVCVSEMLVSLRWEARPQIFSFLLLAILMYVLIPSNKNNSTLLAKALTILLIMILWTNTHIYFPLGLIFIVVVTTATVSESLLIERNSLSSVLPLFLIPACAVLATCLNPWGYIFWQYVYRLWKYPNNYLSPEIEPFNLFDLSNKYSIYLLIMVAVYVYYYWFFRIFSMRRSGILSPSLVITGLGLGLKHAVLIPATSLLIFAGLAQLVARQSIFNRQGKLISGDKVAELTKFWQLTDNSVQALIPKKPIWLAILLTITILGSLTYLLIDPPTLPHASGNFQPPFSAINFLKRYRPPGKMFNDPLFGSVMTWYLPKPDVFFDSRFVQYDPERTLEYLHINNCDPGYQKIWAKYNFDWVFIQKSSPLGNALKQLGWHSVYEDKIAIILTKPSHRREQ